MVMLPVLFFAPLVLLSLLPPLLPGRLGHLRTRNDADVEYMESLAADAGTTSPSVEGG
jgi:hypothetical protein